MTKVIYKYQIATKVKHSINMPKGARILCVQLQNDEPMIWALVDITTELEEITIETLCTGHPFSFDDNVKYIGTYQQGYYVYHVIQHNGQESKVS